MECNTKLQNVRAMMMCHHHDHVVKTWFNFQVERPKKTLPLSTERSRRHRSTNFQGVRFRQDVRVIYIFRVLDSRPRIA